MDWQTYLTPYSESAPVNGTNNVWEYFFEQPDKIGVDDLKNKNYFFSEDKYPYGAVPYYGVTNIFKEGQPTKRSIQEINEFWKTICPIKQHIVREFDNIVEKYGVENCLAVHIRGTDMNFTKGHNRSAHIEDIIDMINIELEVLGLSKIFLCTDELSVIERMKVEFNDKVLFLDSYRSIDGKQGIHLEHRSAVMRENHKYKMAYEVLRDVYLMSKCKALVCGKSNVAYAAIVFNNNQYLSITYTN